MGGFAFSSPPKNHLLLIKIRSILNRSSLSYLCHCIKSNSTNGLIVDSSVRLPPFPSVSCHSLALTGLDFCTSCCSLMFAKSRIRGFGYLWLHAVRHLAWIVLPSAKEQCSSLRIYLSKEEAQDSHDRKTSEIRSSGRLYEYCSKQEWSLLRNW